MASLLEQYTFIASDKDLELLCGQLKENSISISMDTEFIRRTTYYAKLALIQIAVDDRVWLIDPLKISHWQPLKVILVNPNIVKIQHSPSEDLMVFQQVLGILPSPLVDTQFAAGMAGYGFNLGYANLVHQVFGTTLAKTETCSDWLQRPLSDEQVSYAINDVLWLEKLYKHFKQLLQKPDFDKWEIVSLECQQMLEKLKLQVPDDQFYLRIRGQTALSAKERFLLQQMCIWREQIARKDNVPRTWVIRDQCLLQLCRDIFKKKDIQLQDLFNINNYKAPSIKKYGKKVLSTLKQYAQLGGKEIIGKSNRHSKEAVELVKKLKPSVANLAKLLSINKEILASRYDLMTLATYYINLKNQEVIKEQPKILTSWRKELVGEPLLEILKSKGQSN